MFLTAVCANVAGQQLAGLLALLHSCLDVKGLLAGKHPYVLYYLAAAMRPRMLMTVDGEGKLLPVPVRVGQAIDTVAQVRSPHHLLYALCLNAYFMPCCLPGALGQRGWLWLVSPCFLLVQCCIEQHR